MNLKILDHIEENDFKSNFLQSFEWSKFKEKEGWNSYFLHFYREELIGYALLLEKKEKIFKIHYIPRGPIVKNMADLKDILVLIQKFSSERKASLLKIEPQEEYSDDIKYFNKFIPSKRFYQPIDTAIINLKEDILKNIPSKKRGRVRNKHNLVFEETQNIESFYAIYKETFESKNFKGRDISYFKDMKECFKSNMKIFRVIYEDKVISSSVNLIHSDTITYLYSGSDTNFNNLYPGYVLVYNTALLAKETGLKYFDLWGVSRENKKWEGFSEFKFNLGAKPFQFLGSFDYPYNKLLYKLYNSLDI